MYSSPIQYRSTVAYYVPLTGDAGRRARTVMASGSRTAWTPPPPSRRHGGDGVSSSFTTDASPNQPKDHATTTRKQRVQAVLIALLGVLSVSPDAMLLRSMHGLGASPADVAAAKFCGVFVVMVALGAVRGAHRAGLAPRHFVAAACCQVINQLCTTFSLLLTTTARALLIISFTPMWAALMGKLFLGEPLLLRTRVALALSIVAALTMFAPWLLPVRCGPSNSHPHRGTSHSTTFLHSVRGACRRICLLRIRGKPSSLSVMR